MDSPRCHSPRGGGGGTTPSTPTPRISLFPPGASAPRTILHGSSESSPRTSPTPPRRASLTRGSSLTKSTPPRRSSLTRATPTRTGSGKLRYSAEVQHRQLLHLFTSIMLKTVRQKTEGSSFGSAEASIETDGRSSMRRTSSMPSVCDVKQAAAAALRHYDYDKKLNKMQKKALRFTWHRLQTRNGGKRVENVFEEVFDRLVRQLPCIRDMFTTRTFLCAMSRAEMASLRDHAKMTVKVLDCIIRNLDLDKAKRTDTGSPLDPRLLGRAHGPLRPYGMTGMFWEKLGETIIDVVLAQEAVRDLPGAGAAWVVLTACLVDQMRAGFDEARNHTFESKAKTSVVLHHATMRLASVDTPEPPAYLTSSTSSSGKDTEPLFPRCYRTSFPEQETAPRCPVDAGRAYSEDAGGGPCSSGYGYYGQPFTLERTDTGSIRDIDEDSEQPASTPPSSASRDRSPRATPSPPSDGGCPHRISPTRTMSGRCPRAVSPARSASTTSSNIIVHI